MKLAYPNNTVVEVEADEAGSQCVVLPNPGLHLAVDDAFKIWTF